MNKLRSYLSKPMGRVVALMVILGMSVYGIPKVVHLTANVIYFGEHPYLAQMDESTSNTVDSQWEEESSWQVSDDGSDTEDQGQINDPVQDGSGQDNGQPGDGDQVPPVSEPGQDNGQPGDGDQVPPVSEPGQDNGQTGDGACAGWNDAQGNCYNYGEYIDMGDGTKCTMMGYDEPMICEGSGDSTQDQNTTGDCTNGWIADDSRCESYGMWNWLNGEWCVMYDNGTSECASDQPEEDQWEEENICEGPDCTSTSREEVCGNDGISYATEEEMPGNVDVQYYGTCSTPDSRELRNMQQNLKDDIKFDDVLERAEHAQKYITKMLERFEKYLAKAEEKGLSETFSAFVEEKKTLFEVYQAEIDAHIGEIKSFQTLYADFLAEAQSRYDAVVAGGYGSQYLWNFMNKRDSFQIIREVLENRTSEYDNNGVLDMLGKEPVKIAYDAERQGVSVDDLDWTAVTTMQADLQALRDTYSGIVDEMDVLKEEAAAALANDALSQEEVNDLRTDLWDEMESLRWDMEDYRDLEQDFWDSEPWRNFDLMWQSINWAREYSFALKDFENMQTMLDQALAALKVADGLFTEAAAQTVIDDLISTIEDKVLPAAADAMAKAEETKNPEALWYFFNKVMDPFGRYADSQLGYLKDLFYSKYEAQMSDEDRELLVSLFENGPRNDPRDTFVQEFGGDGGDEQAIINYIVGQIDEDMASQIIEKLMGMVSEETLQSWGSYDQDMVNQLLFMSTYADPKNYQAMLTSTESMAATIADMQQQIEGLRSQNSQLKSLLDEVAQANLYGDQAEAFQTTLSELDVANLSTTEVAQLQTQFEEVKEDSENQQFTDGLIPFKDTFGGEWYTYYVGILKNDGVVSGGKDLNGNLTGEYNPADLVTNAEFLKMALNATNNGDVEVTPNGDIEVTPANSAAIGHWAQSFYVQAENLGLELASANPNDPVSRGMVAKTLNDLMGNATVSLTSGEFSDVQPGDEFANDVAAISSAGIMTGSTSEGSSMPTFRPYENLNRAEIAAVITRVMDGQQVTEFEDFDISDFLDELDQMGPVTEENNLNNVFDQPTETDTTTTEDVVQPGSDEEDFWKLNSLLNFLQIMTTYPN